MGLFGIDADAMRAASALTSATLVLFLLAGRIESLRPHATRIRMAIVIAYFAAVAGFLVWFAVR